MTLLSLLRNKRSEDDNLCMCMMKYFGKCLMPLRFIAGPLTPVAAE